MDSEISQLDNGVSGSDEEYVEPVISNPINDVSKLRTKDGKFVKGVSGNPLGRRVEMTVKGFSLVKLLRNEMQKVPTGEQVSYANALVRQIMKQAMGGDSKSQTLIMNYLEGLPRQSIEMTGRDGEPIVENNFIMIPITKDLFNKIPEHIRQRVEASVTDITEEDG